MAGVAYALRVAAAAVCLALVAAAPAAADCVGADLLPTAQDARPFERSTLCLLNAERSSTGLGALSPRTTLSRAAAGYSAQMVRGAFFAHRPPAGPELAGRLARAGYLSRAATDWLVGENLAWATGTAATPRQLVVAWMDSPGHRRNILEPAFRDIGIGVAAGTPAAGPDGVTVTTEFGVRHLRAAGRRPARARHPRRQPTAI
jgi:uncharacterized protein YkwD